MTLFVIDLVFRIFHFFSLIFPMLNVVYDPFLTRKTFFLLCSYFRAHPTTLLQNIGGGGRMHGPSPTSIFGGRPSSPPRSPPLQTTYREKKKSTQAEWHG